MRKVALTVLCVCAGLLLAQSGRTRMRSPGTNQIRAAAAVCCSRAQLAVLEGDPTASTGDFTIRLKMPDGYKIAPHWHPNRENVTVISGNFKVGMATSSMRPR